MFQPANNSPFQVRFNVGPFPVLVDPSFWFMGLLMGWRLEDPKLIAAWVVVVFVSILVHELGHAVASHVFGADAWIRLYAFGGLTSHGAVNRRWKQVVISLAGPGAGFLLAAALWAVWTFAGVRNEVLHFALYQGLFVNFWWGLMNLMPVLPLDGGHVIQELLGPKRMRATLGTSATVGIGVALYAAYVEEAYVAVLFGLLGVRAWMDLSAMRRKDRPVDIPPGTDAANAVDEGWTALRSDQPREAARLGQLALDAGKSAELRNRARDLLAWVALADDEPRSALSFLDHCEPPSAARALSLAMTLRELGRTHQALPHAVAAFAQEPSDTTAGIAAQTHLDLGDAAAARAICQAHPWHNPARRDELLRQLGEVSAA